MRYTPTFFINGARYDGPWDEASFTDAMVGSLGHRARVAALGFASWAPSTGVLLLLAALLAVFVTNSDSGGSFAAFWDTPLGLDFGAAEFRMPLLHWINDALLTVFFLVVGLEIKREFTVGHLASRRSAALPIAAAMGGMAVPALIYVSLVGSGVWQMGWGVPMATDTAFAVALIAMLGARVPVELRIFLTAAAIVDDIGAITVVAIFYSDSLQWSALAFALAAVGFLVFLNRAGVYRVWPYVLTGIVLWSLVHAGGLHATLAGVLLAAFIPTRPPPDYRALVAQADAILSAEARHGGEQFRHGPSAPALRELDAIHDRLESPADRLLRHVAPHSSYLVLPVFALANAGVVFAAEVFGGHGKLMAGIIAGLAIGKPVGFMLASWLAVKTGRGRETRGLLVGAARRRRRAGRHRLHDVVVHRRPGLSGGAGFCGREDRGVHGLDTLGRHRCRRARRGSATAGAGFDESWRIAKIFKPRWRIAPSFRHTDAHECRTQHGFCIARSADTPAVRSRRARAQPDVHLPVRRLQPEVR